MIPRITRGAINCHAPLDRGWMARRKAWVPLSLCVGHVRERGRGAVINEEIKVRKKPGVRFADELINFPLILLNTQTLQP